MITFLLNYLAIFFLTLLVELIVAFVLGYREKKFILAIIAVNLFTHPLLTYILIVLNSLWFTPGLVVITFLEILVILVEARLLSYAFGENTFVKLAIAMNAASYVLGLILFWI